MLNPAQQGVHPDIAQLRHFRPLDDLDNQALFKIAENVTIQHAARKTKLIEKGDTEDSMLYLLEGNVILEATDGARQRIVAHEESGRSPIARLRPCKYDVIAETAVEYLMVPSSLLDASNGPSSQLNSSGLELYEVVEESGEDQQAAEDQLAFQLYEDLNSNQLLLPSLPDVAIRVGQAVNHDLADAKRVARVIENDPVITAKLIKVANSARYGGRATVAQLPDAIARIGMTTTHSLVITFALREIFRCNTPTLYETMRDLWEQARKVGAISHILAQRCGKIDPESALLAGLVHNIGSVAIITYARDFPELSGSLEMLQGVIDRLKSQLGKIILGHWDFPPELVEATVDDPKRAHEGPCDMGDLVIIARQHIGADGEKPPVEETELPAYAKLGFSAEEIHAVLEEAKTEMDEMLALLGD